MLDYGAEHIKLRQLDMPRNFFSGNNCVAEYGHFPSNFLVGGTIPTRLGNAHPNIVPYQDFKTADGYVILAVGNDSQFNRLCHALGQEDWASDVRFSTNSSRVAHREVLVEMIEAVTTAKTTSRWIEMMEIAGVPCGPVNRLDQVFDDKQVLARGMRIEMDHPLAGRLPLVGNPIRMSRSPVSYRVAPPLLDADAAAVLADWSGST